MLRDAHCRWTWRYAREQLTLQDSTDSKRPQSSPRHDGRYCHHQRGPDDAAGAYADLCWRCCTIRSAKVTAARRDGKENDSSHRRPSRTGAGLTQRVRLLYCTMLLITAACMCGFDCTAVPLLFLGCFRCVNRRCMHREHKQPALRRRSLPASSSKPLTAPCSGPDPARERIGREQRSFPCATDFCEAHPGRHFRLLLLKLQRPSGAIARAAASPQKTPARPRVSLSLLPHSFTPSPQQGDLRALN
jgi:hypothetical protein